MFPCSTFMVSTPQEKLIFSVLLIEYHIMIAYGDVGVAPRIRNLRATWR